MCDGDCGKCGVHVPESLDPGLRAHERKRVQLRHLTFCCYTTQLVVVTVRLVLREIAQTVEIFFRSVLFPTVHPEECARGEVMCSGCFGTGRECSGVHGSARGGLEIA